MLLQPPWVITAAAFYARSEPQRVRGYFREIVGFVRSAALGSEVKMKLWLGMFRPSIVGVSEMRPRINQLCACHAEEGSSRKEEVSS